MKTPMRPAPYFSRAALTAAAYPSSSRPSCASRLLRQSYAPRSDRTRNSSNPATCPIHVSSTTVSKSQAANPDRLARNALVIAAEPAPRLLTMEKWLMARGCMLRAERSGGRVVTRGWQGNGLQASRRYLIQQGRQHGKHDRLARVRARARAIVQHQHVARDQPA